MSLLRSLVAASVAVALALPTLVQGAAVIQTGYYSSNNQVTCAGDPSDTYTRETGVCQSSNYDNTASQRFCDTSYYYYVTYSDKACTTVQEVDRTPLGCLNGENIACVNATQGPAYPYAFPVSGFGYARRYLNSSTQDYASCPVGAGTTGYTEYSSLTGCQTDSVYNYSSIEFCATLNGATVRGSYSYNARNCLASSLTRASFSALCNGGTVISCDNSPSLPSNSFKVGGRTNCAGDSTTAEFYPLDTCLDGTKYTCANGNYTQTQYNSDGSSGCSSTVSSVRTWVADGKTCQQDSQYGSDKYIFTCDANSLITAYSASSVAAASWSLLVVGAFAAVFGSRQ